MDREMRSVAQTTDLLCLECEREWIEPSQRWRMYAITGTDPEVGLYCPICASYEFDE